MATAANRDDADERLQLYLAQGDLADSQRRIEALTGDASDRRYFRVHTAGRPTQVVAIHSGPIVFDELPFAVVSKLLHAMPVRAPRILAHDDELGVVALEDLGDVTLQAHLGTAPPAARQALYREAIEIIEVLQRRGRELASQDLLPYQLAFDVEKLMFELRFFVTHFLEGHRRAELTETARQLLEVEFGAIASELAAEPRVLCHRDFHSRNLMVHEGHLFVIDFQDARLGPDTYDLVSLLRDAYVELTAAEVDELIGAFLSITRATAGGRSAFRRRFDLMTVQRTLKALGTFGFQATSRQNERYLENVPRAIAALTTTFSAEPRFSRLRHQLAPLVPELA